MIETAKRVLQIEADAVLALQARIDGDFTKAVEMILAHHHRQRCHTRPHRFDGHTHALGGVVILQHGGNITTLYAHMSKFASKVRNGTRVRQGQTIGYVGKTGLVTGVHLHYEYRLNGVHRNPRTVPLPQAAPISDEYRDDFLASVEPILNELLQYKRTQVASLTAD